jgi:iron complex outermembrane recepter protein
MNCLPHPFRRRAWVALAVALGFGLAGINVAGSAIAADADDEEGAPAAVEGVTVISASPLPGSGLSADLAPAAVQTLSADDLRLGGVPGAAGALGAQLGSVSLSDTLADPFQPDVLVRGFAASPVLGASQGVAVYQNGARINEAFGETVNWDLTPDLAIRRLDVLGANPVFGLNALGGAIVATMKTGFSDPGGDLSVSGGAFGRREAAAQWGAARGSVAIYLAARGLDSDGWRRFSPDHLRSLYAAVGWRGQAASLDLGLTLADDRLFGQSAAPVQELAVDRALVFTNPQENHNRLVFVTLDGSATLTSRLSLQAGLYLRRFRQDVVNGNTTAYVACQDAPGSLCQPDALTPLSDAAGRPIPDLSGGGATPIGEIDREQVDTTSGGASLQATWTAPLLGLDNHLVAGASLDTAATDYGSSAEVGVIGAELRIQPSGLVVTTPENTGFQATPVSLHAVTRYVGLYVTDTLNLTPSLALTAGGRGNIAQVDLADRRGRNLDGANRYERFNPALGLAWKLTPGLTVYGGYAEGSRTPNPSEIECSNPQIPCLLPSSLASDPPTLRQVVSRTWEAGLRGRATIASGAVTWSAGAFRTDVRDDIFGVATSLSSGYFQNIPGTRRQGFELNARYRGDRLSAYLSYSYVEANFQADFLLPSPANPFADAHGDIHVRPGDRLPGMPRSRLKAGIDYELRPGWSVGATLVAADGQTYRGDEAGLLAPLGGYAVVNLRSSLALSRRASLFVQIDNALDARYATLGLLGDPTGVGAPGVPLQGADPRFQSPAPPIAAAGGVKVEF